MAEELTDFLGEHGVRVRYLHSDVDTLRRVGHDPFKAAANGARFHVVDIGDGPAVLLLHGFPTFWWTWRHQLTALADTGYRSIIP